MNQNKASKQDEIDGILNDIATSLRCSRTSLPISTVPKGVVVGCLKFKERGSNAVDCMEVGDNGKEIPYSVGSITNIENKGAKFILLVEKDTVFMSLLDHKFYEKVPCIIITGKRMPDVSTRSFLRRLKVELCLPILGLVDVQILHANNHFVDKKEQQRLATGLELAQQIAFAPPPPSLCSQVISDLPFELGFKASSNGECSIHGKVSCLIDVQTRSMFHTVEKVFGIRI
ncbi:Spo11/DNA topoisomerase VI subunit A [Trema orientale]|uniref:Spo11/DNA topoisomerase VI subunit A n=1 Tax=Trema orientale TaxID=63057 RepID=A0A2P5FLR4_TREOI|nr:Spo11/DNA topoisomerase VI subunit A [Trema orientale]